MTGSSLVSERALARTYASRSYADTYDAVEDYRRVLEYSRTHPAKGSTAIASALDLPRSRIRPWLEDSKPDPVRAIETARDYGWLDAEFGDAAFTGLNALVANVFSGGSIVETNYRPSFALNDRGHNSHVVDALELVGIEYELLDDRDGRADEVRPSTDSTVLGRVLAVLGAPVGRKTDRHLTLPPYLENAPHESRETFVLAYLANRGVHYEDKRTIQIQEERPKLYRDDLASLIEDVAGERVTSGERMVTVSADAARSLGIDSSLID